MKKMTAVLLMALGFSVANAQLSCNDLDDLAGSLDDLAIALEDVESIGLNSELDSELGTLTEVLTIVAQVENDARLTRWIADLKLAWNDMEREDFAMSLDDIIDRLDGLGARDCEGW